MKAVYASAVSAVLTLSAVAAVVIWAIRRDDSLPSEDGDDFEFGPVPG